MVLAARCATASVLRSDPILASGCRRWSDASLESVVGLLETVGAHIEVHFALQLLVRYRYSHFYACSVYPARFTSCGPSQGLCRSEFCMAVLYLCGVTTSEKMPGLELIYFLALYISLTLMYH